MIAINTALTTSENQLPTLKSILQAAQDAVVLNPTDQNTQQVTSASLKYVKEMENQLKLKADLLVTHHKLNVLEKSIKTEMNLSRPEPRSVRGGVQGAQLNSIPIFSDEAGQDCEGWISLIDRAKVQFEWSDQQTAAAIKSKLGGEAGKWLRALEKRHTPGLENWMEVVDGVKPLKVMLENRFKVTVSLLAASEAISDLKQKPSENVSAFFDRVVLALDVKNYHVADKTTAAYKASLDSEIYTFFSAGMKEMYRQSILGGRTDPPATPEELLRAAKASELESGKNKGKVVMETKTEDSIVQQVEKRFEELVRKQFGNKNQNATGNKTQKTSTRRGACFVSGLSLIHI